MLLVRYSEIGLKGKNRGSFENQLVRNIKSKIDAKIEKDSASILIHSNAPEKLKEIFGISWFAEAKEAKLDLEDIKTSVLEVLQNRKPKSFRITANRSNKSFQIKSQDLALEIGKFCEDKGFLVSLKNAELEIFVDILENRCLVYTEKVRGLGGLPVGTSGKVLCLMSGGIDSPVSAFLMAKRGCSVDYLHFYALRDIEEIKKSKIPKIILQLEKFCGKSQLFLIPFVDFQLAALQRGEYELQLFRRFMLKVAEQIAKDKGYKAIVLGDNLNQVASQTLENMTAVQSNISTAIFRPLLTFDKQNIIELAKQIQTYPLSIEEYKDCCSIIVRKPKTKIETKKVLELEKELQMEKILQKTLGKLQNL